MRTGTERDANGLVYQTEVFCLLVRKQCHIEVTDSKQKRRPVKGYGTMEKSCEKELFLFNLEN
jgi:hypothetical protein